MIKLKNILNELLNTYVVQAYMLTDPEYNITDILDQIRALRKVTIVRNITPPEYTQKQNFEYTLVTIKFISRGEAKQDLENLKKDILTSDMSRTDLRIPGVKSFKFKPETLRRI
tara:strand:- start:2011 stop:2352 length:342 start_codon:yes stop_codon:yes gene_type:complete